MAERPRELTLQYSLLISPRLAEIWRWNAQRYGEDHATRYVEFLEQKTRTLKTEYVRGHSVPKRPAYRYMTIKRRAKGHGYVVVYEIRETELFIFYYFHTAQDWQAQLETMLPLTLDSLPLMPTLYASLLGLKVLLHEYMEPLLRRFHLEDRFASLKEILSAIGVRENGGSG